ncbi:MAG TPA: glyoxalase, partial [Lachnoclostridium phytofermentans]|nr:glyoxalase [Lachnoclostridium phytofermentans]
DIQKTYQELLDKEVKVDEILTMPYGSMFNFYDMDGNTFLVREDK